MWRFRRRLRYNAACESILLRWNLLELEDAGMAFRRIALGVMVVALAVVYPAWADEGDVVVRYDNYKFVRVYVSTEQQIEQIHRLDGRLMSEGEGLGLVDYLFPPEALAGVAKLGVPYKVLNDNIQKDIDAERERLARQGAVDERDPAWFNDYKNIDAINAKLNTMVADRPDLGQMLDLGVTLQGRHIYGIRITGPGSNKPAVLFNGCHHAREWISTMVPMWIADKFIYEYDTNPTVQSLVNSVEFFIVPVVNIDGYVYTWTNDRLWRKNRRPPPPNYNCYGVDDNRNYSVNFGGDGSSDYPCDETYHGPYPFSELETAAMRDFAIAHPQIVASQSYHSYSQLFMSPWGWTSTLPADNDTFMEVDQTSHDLILAVHGMQYDYGPIYSTIYPASGNDVDWYYDHEGIFSFTTELRDTGQYGFELPPAQIIPTCEENYAAALYLGQWSASPVKISFPNGLPSRLTPGTPENVLVKIKVVGGMLDPSTALLHSRIGPNGGFTATLLTSQGIDMYEATLPATPCGKTLYYYFSAATTTGIVGLSPPDAPNSTYQAMALPILTVYDKNMDVNPNWTKSPNNSSNQWAWGTPTGGGGQYGGPDPTSGYTGTKVAGYNLNGDYANDLAEMSYTTPAFSCAGLTGVKVSFYRWLGVEQSTYDHAYVRVSNNGSTFYNVWQNTATIYDGAWVYQELDISAYADNKPAVYLRWVMGTTDGGWHYCGWNVDDVQVWAADPNGCPYEVGDLNCDGAVSFGDINPFVLALADPTGYANAFPDCDISLADINGDGSVDFGDINPFVALLTQ
jgi:murein tripeptide amidase MpaA